MKQIIREYGPITTLLVCSVLGYVWYDANRSDVLAYSLDTLGQRLVEMVDDTSAQAVVADAFGGFKERVLDGEITPDEVEVVAANVLNLQQQAARLTSEQAELVLQSAYIAVAESTDVAQALPAPSGQVQIRMRPPRPSVPLAPGERAELSERLSSLVAFHESIAELSQREQQEVIANHIHIDAVNGLRVRVDGDLAEALPAAVYERVMAAVTKLERRQMVVWDPHLAATLRNEREQAVRETSRLTEMAAREHRSSTLAVMESLKKLEVMGYRSGHGVTGAAVLSMSEAVDSAAIHEVVQQALEEAAAEVEAAVEAAAEATRGSGGSGHS